MTSWQAPSATVSFTYDPNGNMMSKSGFSEYWVYGWDFENRLIIARRANKIVRYDYDALGRKVSRFGKAVGPTAKYTYDGQDIILDDGSEGIVKYQNGPGIDNKLKMVIGGQSKYFLQDHLGSTVALTGQDGAVLEQTDYEAFGEPTNDFTTRYQFTGRERDPFTGLYDYRARWYNPQLGRFISEDPIGFRGGDVNLYGYVWNRPNMFTDPSGKFPEPCVLMFPLGFGTISERLDRLQLALAALGLIPGLGEVADGADGLVSLARGDYTGAALSVVSVVPGFGTMSGITKVCRMGDKVGSSIAFSKRNFRKNLGELTDEIPANSHAHHVFPQKYEAPFDKAYNEPQKLDR